VPSSNSTGEAKSSVSVIRQKMQRNRQREGDEKHRHAAPREPVDDQEDDRRSGREQRLLAGRHRHGGDRHDQRDAQDRAQVIRQPAAEAHPLPLAAAASLRAYGFGLAHDVHSIAPIAGA
jgi:hypothetical protein